MFQIEFLQYMLEYRWQSLYDSFFSNEDQKEDANLLFQQYRQYFLIKNTLFDDK